MRFFHQIKHAYKLTHKNPGCPTAICKKYNSTIKNINNVPSSDDIVYDLLTNKLRSEMFVMSLLYCTGMGSKENIKNPHIVCVRNGNKGCTSPGLSDNPPYFPKQKNELEEPQSTSDIMSGFGLLDAKLYQKSLKEAELNRKKLAESLGTFKYKDSSTNIPKPDNMIRACQSKKTINNGIREREIKDPCSFLNTLSDSKCEQDNVQRMSPCQQSPQETSCKSQPKPSKSNCIFDSKKDDSKDPCKRSPPKSTCSSKQEPTCGSIKSKTKEPCESDKENAKCVSKCESPQKFESNPYQAKESHKKHSLCGTKCVPNKTTETSSAKSPSSSSSKCPSLAATTKCDSKAHSNANDPCRIPPVTKAKSCGSSSEIDDPCKIPSKTLSGSKCSSPIKPKCSRDNFKASCNAPSASSATKCKLKCGSSSTCEKPQKEKIGTDSQKACKRAAEVKCSSKTDNLSPNSTSPCGSGIKSRKSSCGSMAKQEIKCGTPPRGNTSPKCKKDTKCGSQEPSSCKTKCALDKEPKDPCKISSASPASNSRSKCSLSNSCEKPQQSCDSEETNPCESMVKQEIKCGRPPKGNTNPRCKKDTKCGSQESSSCRSKCASDKKESTDPCKTSSATPASKKSSRCESSSPCKKPQKETLDADSCNKDAEVPCNLVKESSRLESESSCGSEIKNLCKSSCDSMNAKPETNCGPDTKSEPESKCGQPTNGDTRSRCKKNSKCGSNDLSSCKQPDTSAKTKCGASTKLAAEENVSKCESKTCAPSRKTSKSEIKPKSSCSPSNPKRKTGPSSMLQKRKIYTLARFSVPDLVFARHFSDDCPEKPKGSYKPESKRSDEYRRETCHKFSWETKKPRRNQTVKHKNCYPEETQEFCPDTACYKVYAETSGKADKKKGNKDSKANKFDGNKALSTNTANFPLLKPGKHCCKQQTFKFSSDSNTNQEALIERPYKICTRKILIPEVCDNDVLISIDSVALSDSDIFMFETGAKHIPELTLGNEASGVVQQVGKKVCNIKVGDHVALESGIPCGKCDLCKTGRYNLCNNISFKGFLRKCSVHPASFCHKICPTIPMEQAALVPQLALGCNACYQAVIKPNSNVAIIGSCAMTVCAAMCAISMGAENVCVMCGMPETQILIEQFLTEKVNYFDSKVVEKGLVRMILASLGTFPDIVINCSCCTKTMNAGIIALKPTGTCIVAGFLSECVSFNIMDALMKEIRILPSFRSKNMFPLAIHLLESGRTPVECLIANCNVCQWNELECAFKLALSEGNNGARKAIVKCQEGD